MTDQTPGAAEAQLSWFQTTHWSVVLAAGRDSQTALENLCHTYWRPLYTYIRHRGYSVEEAEDLTQEFFLHLLERKDVARANPDEGRFRSYLLMAMNHFLVSEWRKSQTLKRGGGESVVPLEEFDAEENYFSQSSEQLTPEDLYERRWALALLEHALARLQERWNLDGKAQQFEDLKPFLSAEATDGEYAALASSLKESPSAVAVAVHRLRKQYRDLVREEIAHTVSSPGEVEEELHHLVACCGGALPPT